MIVIPTHQDAHHTWLIRRGNLVQEALSASFLGTGKPLEGNETADTPTNAVESRNNASPRSLASLWSRRIDHPGGAPPTGGDDLPSARGLVGQPRSLPLTLLPGRSCDGRLSRVLSPSCAAQAPAEKGSQPLSRVRQSENITTERESRERVTAIFSTENISSGTCLTETEQST